MTRFAYSQPRPGVYETRSPEGVVRVSRGYSRSGGYGWSARSAVGTSPTRDAAVLAEIARRRREREGTGGTENLLAELARRRRARTTTQEEER